LLAFYLGFILDLIGGSVPGVLALAYIMIFLCSFFISDLLDTGKNHVIVLFSFICVFLKETMLQTFYFLVFDIRMRPDIFSLILIQSFVVGLVAPVVFHLIDRTGIFLYEKKA
jgi:cell shape-determining protein MreD